MKDTHPAILLANGRPSGRANKSIEALTDWAIDAEDMLRKLVEQNQESLSALKLMESRFGTTSSRGVDKPKTYGCHHVSETCQRCEGLVTAWKAVQATLTVISKINHESDNV